MKQLKIHWLGSCGKCGNDKYAHLVTTEKGSVDTLYEDDVVECTVCGHKGEIYADGEIAEVVWNK